MEQLKKQHNEFKVCSFTLLCMLLVIPLSFPSYDAQPSLRWRWSSTTGLEVGVVVLAWLILGLCRLLPLPFPISAVSGPTTDLCLLRAPGAVQDVREHGAAPCIQAAEGLKGKAHLMSTCLQSC